MKLNNIQVQSAKSKEKMYRLSDGDSLYLEIHPNGSKYWRMTYRFNGTRKQVAFGKYPIISLKEARDMRMEAKRLLVKGIDPVENKRQEKLNRELEYDNNFEAIAREWHSRKFHTWQPKHAENILNRLSTYIFPIIGRKPIKDIKAQELLHAIKPVEEAGKHEMAHRLLQTCGQIFRYGVACGKVERDITSDLKGALRPTKGKNYAYLQEEELPAFLVALNRYDLDKSDGGCNGNPTIKLGFQLLILNFVRSGEMRGAKWEEIDYDKAQWRIPAERMKMKEQHIVPLSKQSVKLLKRLQEITGSSYSGFVLPSLHNPRKTISENTFLRAIELLGYKGKTVGHGFRSTASTILNENGFRADVIERQLAHCERDQIRASYNHAQYLPERVEMMQWWGNYLQNKGMYIDAV